MRIPISMAVVGVGHFGRFHAEKISRLPRAKLVAVADIDADRAAEVGRALNVEAVTDYRELLDVVDAVSVVVPTFAHYQVASEFLDHGVDVLVEKPITDDLDEARRLIELANRKGRILQVGHLERFSGMVAGLRRRLFQPLYIESVRIAPFKPRGTDVNVILDLMIHDLDHILSFVEDSMMSVDAAGAPVFSPSEDIASARLKFSNGCIANITASRISLKTERKMRIFQPDTYIVVDFDRHTIMTIPKPKATPRVITDVDIVEETYSDGDPLEREIEAFVSAVIERRAPVVSGEDGLTALRAATMVTESLRTHADFVNQGLSARSLSRKITQAPG